MILTNCIEHGADLLLKKQSVENRRWSIETKVEFRVEITESQWKSGFDGK